MNAHTVIAVLLCTTFCEQTQLRVWDGDTFRVGWGSRSERVRLETIDAPEIEGRCAFETELAQRSKQRLADLLRGRRVEIIRHGIDPYDRTLATIRVDRADIGAILVREGLARQWTGHREPWCR